MRANVHASCVEYKKKGILIYGPSGRGKSDLALRLIMEQGAKLVADDRVNLQVLKGKIKATAPTILKGFLEVRGVGIVKFSSVNADLFLAIRLVEKREMVERLPERESYEFGGISIPQISLYAFDASAPSKILAALTML